MRQRVTQAQADDAAEQAARFWPEFGRRWPWTRSPGVAEVYGLIGEQTVALLRLLPALQWSNQARWYQRVVRDTPAILALTPDALRIEAGALTPGGGPSSLDGKHVVSIIYPAAEGEGDPTITEPSVAKTLLASTALNEPYYAAQLAHELLNCFCATEWDGQTLRSGVLRSQTPRPSASTTEGAALNDLLLDAILAQLLPAISPMTTEALLEGAQGPYWRIANTLADRLRGVPTLPALFSVDTDTQQRFAQGLAVALDQADAVNYLDSLAAAHDWAALRSLLGEN